MIKVLNIISDTNVGGAGRVILNYLKYMDRDRFEVSVALPQGSLLKPQLEPFGIPIYEVDGMADKSLDWKAIKKLKQVIRLSGADIVHTHGSMSGRIAGRQCGKRVVYTRHSAFPVSPRIRQGVGRWLNKTINEHYSDRIIAVSPATRENLTDGGISEKKIEIILNGVEPVTRRGAADCLEARKKYGVPEGVFTAGILARIEDYKGHLDILEAARILKEQGRQFQILIAGTGAFEETVRSRIKELELGDCVNFLGFVSDVAEVLSILDVQLNASYGTEATSLALLEGFSMGIPAVVSDYGGNPWLVTNGENGYVFKTRDARGMAEALLKLMDDREALSHMGEGAQKVYKTRFTGEIFAANVEKVYADLYGGKYGK